MVWLKTVLIEQRKRYLRVKRDGNFQSKKIYAMIHLIETIRPLFQNQRSVMKEIYVFRTRAKEVVFTVNMKKKRLTTVFGYCRSQTEQRQVLLHISFNNTIVEELEIEFMIMLFLSIFKLMEHEVIWASKQNKLSPFSNGLWFSNPIKIKY